MFADSISWNDLHFFGFAMTELIKLARMAAVMHKVDHVYSIWNTLGDYIDQLPMMYHHL